MPSFRRLAALTLAGTTLAVAADAPAPDALPKRAVMTGEQVVQILDETVDWYRTLGAQQQSSTQPSDLLILYANRQTADKVINLAFEIARANAELLSSEAELTKDEDESSSSRHGLAALQKQLDTKQAELRAEIAGLQKNAAGAPKDKKSELELKIGETQSELDLVNARRNMAGTMSQFVYRSDSAGANANALKEHIDAIAASIPSSSNPPAAAPVSGAATATATATATNTSSDASSPLTPSQDGAHRLGIWDLASSVFKLQSKLNTIDEIDRRTAQLHETFKEIRSQPLEQIRSLAKRGDDLSEAADHASSEELRNMRGQFDTLAWLFKQTSAILIPLSQEAVLLEQYRSNLKSWRTNIESQYRSALKALGVRVLILLALLAIVFAAAEVWRRTVFRYVHEPRRRYQLLLIRKIVLGALIVAIVGFTFATEISSLVTFAGLITAGLAVAMQSVLVSIVGYFFLIGKYGIRIGDRVQIGNVTGEVIDLGLVRLHLMELSGVGPLGPTGRVVAFANSIVFQASGGIFKQIPGVNLAWHEITLTLPADADYTLLKERLLGAANTVLNDYREDFTRQEKELQKTASVRNVSEVPKQAQATVQLKFSATSVEAIVRYPVQLAHAAEMDERVSRELLNVLRSAAAPALSGPKPVV